MGLQIIITDPEQMAPKALERISDLLWALAGNSSEDAPSQGDSAIQRGADAASAALSAPTFNAAGVQIDSRGLPWDARIHSEKQTKTPTGQWRNKRNVADSVIAQVEGELRTASAAPAPGPAAVPPVPDAAALAAFAASMAPAAQVPPPPPFVPAPPAAAPASAWTYQTIVARIQQMSGADMAGTQGKVAQVCAALQIPNLPVLATRPDLFDAFAAHMQFAA